MWYQKGRLTMQCPRCHQNGSRVIDSRPADEGHTIRRRRECEACGFRFTTFERIEQQPLLVIKKDGTRQEFNRGKLLRGIIRASEKRPITSDQMERIVDRIENDVRLSGDSEVNSKYLGERVMKELAQLDDVAYIRFASVYRQFKDMNMFIKEVQELISKEHDTQNHSH